MRRAKSREHTGEMDDDDDLKLTELVQFRVSKRAKDLIKVRARGKVQTPTAWVRVTVYKALGLYKDE